MTHQAITVAAMLTAAPMAPNCQVATAVTASPTLLTRISTRTIQCCSPVSCSSGSTGPQAVDTVAPMPKITSTACVIGVA